MLNYSIVNKLITVPIFKIKLCERRVFENMVYGLIDWLIIPCLMINYNLSRDIKAASSWIDIKILFLKEIHILNT